MWLVTCATEVGIPSSCASGERIPRPYSWDRTVNPRASHIPIIDGLERMRLLVGEDGPVQPDQALPSLLDRTPEGKQHSDPPIETF